MTQAIIKTTEVDATVLEDKVKAMYRSVADNPHGEYHFEMGRAMAERLGYPAALLDRIPTEAIESFAGVGHYFDLAGLEPGERVLDLGSGSGMDSFVAAELVGRAGAVVGVDMTDAQLRKAEALRTRAGYTQVTYQKGYIQSVPREDASFDAVISNGVINLAPKKARVFQEAARLLRPGGRLALADIVTERPLPENVTCDATLWAACIGGAQQQDRYLEAIRAAGLVIEAVRDNPEYHFISDGAKWATDTFGVKSISILARKPG